MSWTLGDITLKRPVSFGRKAIDVMAKHRTISGKDVRDITRQKEEFTLQFEALTQSQVSDILSEYNKKTAVNFAVSDGNLTITTTSVIVTINKREYVKGPDFRENITLVLTEV